MSIAAQNWAWNQKIDSPAAKLLLLALADQTDSRDGSVRYQETTAEFFSEKCGFSLRTFWRCITDLEQAGHLRREGGLGRGNLTEFWLCLDGAGKGANLAGFSDEKVCQIVQESVPNQVEKGTSNGTLCDPIHYTNYQSTKESTNARARARDAGAPRAPARKDDPHVFVKRGTRWWKKLVKYHERIGDPRQMLVFYPGKGGDGRDFRTSVLEAAGCQPARGPPDDDAASDDGSDEQPGNEHDARQSAAGLRGAESMDHRAGDRLGRSQPADG